MLKWLVMGLLLCNAAYFVWQHNVEIADIPGSRVVLQSHIDGSSLVLLSEGARGDKAATQVVATPGGPLVSVCHMIGPFTEKISAHQVRDRLRALDITVNTYQINIPSKSDYWVYLTPRRSRNEALDLLRELQNKKIDSFLIGDGELVNGISLGFFTKKQLAEAVLKQRREQGYDAKLREVQRFSQEFWEVFADKQFDKFSDEYWQQIKAGVQSIELRKNSCDLIASAEKLD